MPKVKIIKTSPFGDYNFLHIVEIDSAYYLAVRFWFGHEYFGPLKKKDIRAFEDLFKVPKNKAMTHMYKYAFRHMEEDDEVRDR